MSEGIPLLMLWKLHILVIWAIFWKCTWMKNAPLKFTEAKDPVYSFGLINSRDCSWFCSKNAQLQNKFKLKSFGHINATIDRKILPRESVLLLLSCTYTYCSCLPHVRRPNGTFSNPGGTCVGAGDNQPPWLYIPKLRGDKTPMSLYVPKGMPSTTGLWTKCLFDGRRQGRQLLRTKHAHSSNTKHSRLNDQMQTIR